MQHEATASVPDEKPRRTKVKDRRGIYYREGANGRRRYEITYRDSEGRQRWKVVPGGLKDADAELDEVRRRLRLGERLVPTKATFKEVADAWLATQGQLRPRTRESYESALRTWLLPRFGRMRIGAVTQDHVAVMIAEMAAKGRGGWTVRGALTPLSRIFGYAMKRGMIGANPVSLLDKGERPSVGRTHMRILSGAEIGALLNAAPDDSARTMLATAVFTGLRLGELLGLTWANVDFDLNVIRVRRQFDRDRLRSAPKTEESIRDVVLMPALARMLKEHRLRSAPYGQATDFVFAGRTGEGRDHTVPRRTLRRAVEAAKLEDGDRPKIRFHDMRHTFASVLIANGSTVAFVARQLGHKSPRVTLDTYTHLFDAAGAAEQASAALERGFGAVLDGNAVETGDGNGPQTDAEAAGSNVAFLPGAATAGN